MNTFPVVLVHGLFGWGQGELPINYWGSAKTVPTSGLKLYESAVGPVSSFHDRACELLAQIKGCKVDYGAAHSTAEGHARYGKDFTGKGFNPTWSATNPVHLVGHSAGGNTIRMAQHLLSTNHYGWGSSADWVKSISCISSVINGTALPYMLGCDWKTGLLTTGAGDFLAWFVKVLTVVAGNTGLTYDFDLNQWGFPNSPMTLADAVTKIKTTKLFTGKDNLAYDLTFQGCWDVNKVVKSNAKTYYFGHGTSQTYWNPLTGTHNPTVRMSPVLALGANWQGEVNIVSKAPTPGWGTGLFTNAQWWENDGCVPIKSQYYPLQPTGISHTNSPGIAKKTSFTPGTWHWEDTYDNLISFDHLDIVCGSIADPICIIGQKAFYTDMWKRLASLV